MERGVSQIVIFINGYLCSSTTYTLSNVYFECRKNDSAAPNMCPALSLVIAEYDRNAYDSPPYFLSSLSRVQQGAMHRLMTVSLGSVSGLALRIAFAVGAIPGSFYISPVASSSADSVAFPNCTGATSFIGDGNCDASNNNVVCMVANANQIV